MSLTPSISTSSTSSLNTNPPMHSNEQNDIDLSNRLYNDHLNYQTIFSNDSRFFDTSLHLFKSYKKLGYIQQIDNRKGKKLHFLSHSVNTLRPSVNGNQNHLKSKSTLSIHQHMNDNDDGTLKPQLRRNNEHVIIQRSVSNRSKTRSSKVVQENPQKSAFHNHPWPTPSYSENNNENDNNNNDDDDDDDDEEPDIIITRL